MAVCDEYGASLGVGGCAVLFAPLSVVSVLAAGATVIPDKMKGMIREPLYTYICLVAPSGSCKVRLLQKLS